jgi:hypothetical protein
MTLSRIDPAEVSGPAPPVRALGVLFSLVAGLLAASTQAQTTPDVMFVTSATGTGNLSTWLAAEGRHGLDAGNHICQKLAGAAGLANPDTFQAWLSGGNTDAACNIKARGGHPPTCGSFAVNNPGPWARTDGAPFALNVATLTAGEVLNPPRFDEHGNQLALDERLWTGTDADGRLASFGGTCDSVDGPWDNAGGSPASGAVGFVQYGPKRWTQSGASSCNQLGHLACFQHSIFGGPSFLPFESEGALVFRTSTTYTGDLGSYFEADGQESLAAGDAICQARARAGDLPAPASFRAWISVVGVDAIDHIGTDGPFKRPDGVQIASSSADLTDGELASPLAETELRSYGESLVRTGTGDIGVFDDRNCFDFTQSDNSVHGVAGLSAGLRNWSFLSDGFGCGAPLPLYCFSSQPLFFWSGFEESGGGFWRWSAAGD